LIRSVRLGIICNISSDWEIFDLSGDGNGMSGLMVALAVDYHGVWNEKRNYNVIEFSMIAIITNNNRGESRL